MSVNCVAKHFKLPMTLLIISNLNPKENRSSDSLAYLAGLAIRHVEKYLGVISRKIEVPFCISFISHFAKEYTHQKDIAIAIAISYEFKPLNNFMLH
jgi:hypothetical protein